MTYLIIFLVTGAYSGFSPVASGTAGTLVGVLVYFLLPVQTCSYTWCLLLITGASFWLSQKGEIIFDKPDDGHIVIDEIVGFLVAMYALPATWGYILGAFFLFRVFDVIKPPPIQYIEGLPGGFGVVLDDVIAGVYANLLLQLFRIIVR